MLVKFLDFCTISCHGNIIPFYKSEKPFVYFILILRIHYHVITTFFYGVIHGTRLCLVGAFSKH